MGLRTVFDPRLMTEEQRPQYQRRLLETPQNTAGQILQISNAQTQQALANQRQMAEEQARAIREKAAIQANLIKDLPEKALGAYKTTKEMGERAEDRRQAQIDRELQRQVAQQELDKSRLEAQYLPERLAQEQQGRQLQQQAQMQQIQGQGMQLQQQQAAFAFDQTEARANGMPGALPGETMVAYARRMDAQQNGDAARLARAQLDLETAKLPVEIQKAKTDAQMAEIQAKMANIQTNKAASEQNVRELVGFISQATDQQDLEKRMQAALQRGATRGDLWEASKVLKNSRGEDQLRAATMQNLLDPTGINRKDQADFQNYSKILATITADINNIPAGMDIISDPKQDSAIRKIVGALREMDETELADKVEGGLSNFVRDGWTITDKRNYLLNTVFPLLRSRLANRLYNSDLRDKLMQSEVVEAVDNAGQLQFRVNHSQQMNQQEQQQGGMFKNLGQFDFKTIGQPQGAW